MRIDSFHPSNLFAIDSALEGKLKDLFIAGNIEELSGCIQHNGASITEPQMLFDFFPEFRAHLAIDIG